MPSATERATPYRLPHSSGMTRQDSSVFDAVAMTRDGSAQLLRQGVQRQHVSHHLRRIQKENSLANWATHSKADIARAQSFWAQKGAQLLRQGVQRQHVSYNLCKGVLA